MLMGNLTRDPEVRSTTGGTAVAELTLAINRNFQDKDGNKQEETTFADITFWGRKAEVIGEYVRKGDPLYVEGRLTLDSWEDKETGQKRSKLKVTGETFEFLQGKASGREDAVQPASNYERAQEAARNPAPANVAPVNPPAQGDDIPF